MEGDSDEPLCKKILKLRKRRDEGIQPKEERGFLKE